MDILKVFLDEPAVLDVLAPIDGGSSSSVSLDELVRGATNSPGYGRAYFAGTRLPDHPGESLKVGATALTDPSAFIRPLLEWAGLRQWMLLRSDGTTIWPTRAETAPFLSNPVRVAVLACSDGPVDSVRLANAIGGEGRDGKAALRAALDTDETLALLIPEPAHDGHDWSLVARSPLREALVAELRAVPARPDLRIFVVPHRKARSEHTFYFEQWSLDNPPEGTEEIQHYA